MRCRREVLGAGEISCVRRLKTWESGEGEEERRDAGVSEGKSEALRFL